MRIIEFEGKSHVVYTLLEADSRGIKHHGRWRTGPVGDWIRTRDKCVMQILDRVPLIRVEGQEKPGSAVKTPFGWIASHALRIYAKSTSTYRPSPKGLEFWRPQRELQNVFLKSLVNHGKLVKIGDYVTWRDEDVIGAYMMTHRENSPITALKRGRWLLSRERNRRHVSRLARNKALELGWTEGKYVDELNALFNQAKDDPKTDLRVVRLFLKDLGEITGALDKIKDTDGRAQLIVLSPDYERLIEILGGIMAQLEALRAQSANGEIVMDIQTYEEKILPKFRELMSHSRSSLEEKSEPEEAEFEEVEHE